MKHGFTNTAIKLVSLALAVSFTGSAALSDVKTVEGELTVSTASGAEKIMRQSAYNGGDTLEISAVRNEYEAAQIIVSSKRDTLYEITPSDLKNQNGDVLGKDNFSLYHEKYVYIDYVLDEKSNITQGYVPDALLPMDVAVAYGENVIFGGQNQAVWAELYVPKDQAAGVYTGNFTVKTDYSEYFLPVSVKIYDYTLADEVHTATKFGISDRSLGIGELDCSYEMAKTYYDFLLEHKISATSLPYGNMWKSNPERFFDDVEQYTLDPRCSCIGIPYNRTNDTVTVEVRADGFMALGEDSGKSDNKQSQVSVINWSELEDLFMRFVDQSVTRGVDLFKKASTYISLFDEFDQYDVLTSIKNTNCAVYNLTRLNNLVAATSEVVSSLHYTGGVVTRYKTVVFSEDAGIATYKVEEVTPATFATDMTKDEFAEFKTSVAKSAGAVRNVTVGAGTGECAKYVLEHTDTSFCESIRHLFIDYEYIKNNDGTVFSGDFLGETYEKISWSKINEVYHSATGNDKWIYTAATPRAPYATYHIDDNLLSARWLSWQMYQKGVTGNLFWVSNLYEYSINGNNDITPKHTNILLSQDMYSDPLRFPDAYGDGFLTYPGRNYGVKGPIGSIRLKAARDGIEDFDILYALESSYAENGVTSAEFDALYSSIIDGMNTKDAGLVYDNDYLDKFAKCRETICGLLELVAKTGVTVKVKSVSKTAVVFEISSPNGVTLAVNGKAVSGDRTAYEFTQNCGNMTVEATYGGVSYKVSVKAALAKGGKQ